MIMAAGVEDPGDGQPRKYKFFEDELFGIERTLQHLVEEYLSPASRRLDIRKRILMLVGPVGGGKSTLVTLAQARTGEVLARPMTARSTPSRAARCTRSRCT